MSHLNRSREHKQVHQMNSLGFFHSHLRAFSGLFALLANLIIWTCTLFVLFCFVFLFYSLPVCALFFFFYNHPPMIVHSLFISLEHRTVSGTLKLLLFTSNYTNTPISILPRDVWNDLKFD